MYTIEDYLFGWGVLLEIFMLGLTIHYYLKNRRFNYSSELRTCIFIFALIAFFMGLKFVIPNQHCPC